MQLKNAIFEEAREDQPQQVSDNILLKTTTIQKIFVQKVS